LKFESLILPRAFLAIASILCTSFLILNSSLFLPAWAVLGDTKTEVQSKYGAPQPLLNDDYYEDAFRFNGWLLKVRYNKKTQRVVGLSLFLPGKDYIAQMKLPQEGKVGELAGRFGHERLMFQQEMADMSYYSYRSYVRWIYRRIKEVEIELILDDTAHSLLK